VSDQEIQDIVITANLTPRKCLGFKTPFQAILKELGKDVQIRFSRLMRSAILPWRVARNPTRYWCRAETASSQVNRLYRRIIDWRKFLIERLKGCWQVAILVVQVR
jgi:hypothetical protein